MIMRCNPKNWKSEIKPKSRSILGRRRRVWDARGEVNGMYYNVTGAPSRKAAIDTVVRDIEYIRTQGTYDAGCCLVRPIGERSWEFVIAGRCVMLYEAENCREAALYAAEAYAFRPEVKEFAEESRKTYGR